MKGFSNPDPKYILQLIAEGYLDEDFYIYRTAEDRYVRVVNPKYQLDNGEDPYIVYDTFEGEEDES